MTHSSSTWKDSYSIRSFHLTSNGNQRPATWYSSSQNPCSWSPTKIHSHLWARPDNMHKTNEELLQNYYWPNIDKDISAHLATCHHCPKEKRLINVTPELISSWLRPTDPNKVYVLTLLSLWQPQNLGTSSSYASLPSLSTPYSPHWQFGLDFGRSHFLTMDYYTLDYPWIVSLIKT